MSKVSEIFKVVKKTRNDVEKDDTVLKVALMD